MRSNKAATQSAHSVEFGGIWQAGGGCSAWSLMGLNVILLDDGRHDILAP